MLDEFSTCLNPPCHELLSPEEFQLFLFRFLGKDAGDSYQIRSCKDKGVKGLDLIFGEPLPWMMLQTCFGQIAIQAYATFPGKCFELRPDFIRTSESMYSGRLLGGVSSFSSLSITFNERDEYKTVRKKDTVCEPASSPRNF